MTTTIFRKNGRDACIASDSRVTFVDSETSLPTYWFDSSDFLKTLTIDGVMYGFAGANVMFKAFLQHYTTKCESEFLLDTLVQIAKQKSIQFFILRYDNSELKLFAYSPPDIQDPASEIFRISSDPAISSNVYAIGSGKFSKEYKKHRTSVSAQVPIRRIIAANELGFKKAGMLNLWTNGPSSSLKPEESKQAYLACQSRGGDLFTGGEVKMTKNATKEQIDEQVAVMDRMDQQAKSMGSVCASPVMASLEVRNLKSIGQYAVSPLSIEQSEKRTALLSQINKTLSNSL